jgi:molybdenum cofactor cytidylyltransferase
MITAIVLAAGESKRMGRPKMLLPWGDSTVLGRVLAVLRAAEVDDILVVTGGAREQVEAIAREHDAPTIFNADYARGEMLSSIQAGLRFLASPLSLKGRGAGGEGQDEAEAALLVLGDQPQLEERSVRAVVGAYRTSKADLVIPSYQMRRGHPWLAARPLWSEILQMQSPQTPRDFLNRHAAQIEYVIVESRSVIEDLDTPEDYLKSRP